MNDQRVKTDNEVIAEFMAAKIDRYNYLLLTIPPHQHSSDHWHATLKFDTSWDWLMPAIQRAKESIKEAGWGTPTEKEAWSRLRMCLNEVSNINIQNAHYCLVKYIEWYQKQKSS